jgi:hypothetical protein
MGLFDGITGILDSSSSDNGTTTDIFGNAGGISDALGGLGQFDSVSASPSVPVNAYAMPVMAQVPMIAQAAASGIVRWAVKFPSLWQALQKYRAAGISMSVSKLWRMFKQVGPTAMAGAIGVAALMDLMTYKSTHKNRHMNVANTHALRRSLRRLKGFERLSHRVSAQLGRVASRGRRRPGRCSTCRKSPCSC